MRAARKVALGDERVLKLGPSDHLAHQSPLEGVVELDQVLPCAGRVAEHDPDGPAASADALDEPELEVDEMRTHLLLDEAAGGTGRRPRGGAAHHCEKS